MHLLDYITHHFKNEVASFKNFFWALTNKTKLLYSSKKKKPNYYDNSYKFPSVNNVMSRKHEEGIHDALLKE